jgi:hypothetical protein
LDHQNHSEILETIGTCLDDWSNEKQQEDLAVMEKDINGDGGRIQSEPKSRGSKSHSNEGQGTENGAQYVRPYFGFPKEKIIGQRGEIEWRWREGDVYSRNYED